VDWSGYFDSIPHAELMKSVARRVSDKVMLHLIQQWREAAIEAAIEEEDDGRGNRKRNTHNRDTRRGTPQWAPISPLLSNRYVRRFIVWWKQRGGVQRWAAHIVN
jgi:retron-type reverse transcriptase